MQILPAIALGLALFSSGCLAVYPPPVSVTFVPSRVLNRTGNDLRADAVKAAFKFAWAGYEAHALPHDELHPRSNSFGDPRNGWGATAVDALDTAIIMGLTDIVDTILNFIPNIDFDHTTDGVSLFETTIRYLGGMLAGYDLLKGPFSGLTTNSKAVDSLLTQSQRLADNIKYAFDSTTGIPSNNLIFTTNPKSTDGGKTNGLATVGTLILEWSRLSDLLNDQLYGNLTQRAESFLLNPKYKSGLSSPWPGLLGTNIDIDTGLFQDNSGGWNGGDDSYYEYLLKMYVYDSSRFSSYRDKWIQVADSTIANLASHPQIMSNLTFLAAYSGKTLSFGSQHLACFDGGSFLLGGLVLSSQKYTDFGLALTDSCHATYASTATHIGPEAFAWQPSGTTSSHPSTPSDIEFNAKNGFWITNGAYALRPEVVESYYYAYRSTKDQKYRDWAWDAFLAINSTCQVGSGYSEIQDVNQASGAGFADVQDSFFLAETLKYLYLIQADEAVFQTAFQGKNEWVFNTEAHLLKVVGPPV